MTTTPQTTRTRGPREDRTEQVTQRGSAAALISLTLLGGAVWWLLPVTVLLALAVTQPVWLGRVDISLWQMALYPVAWTSAIIAVVVAAIHLPVHVAGGIDRRTFVRGAALAYATNIAIAAVVGVVGFAVERAALVPAGLDPTLAPGHLFTATDQYSLVAIEIVLSMATAWLVGWLVALAYYRTGWWRGTLWALLALAPGILIVGLLVTGTAGLDVSTGWRVVAAALVVIGTAAVAQRVTTGVELRGSSTWMRTG